MDVRSLGFRTDLSLLTLSGSEVEDRGTHLVVRTPANPDYRWGNFLLLAQAPVPGGEKEVVGAFRTEFPDAAHVSIGIDQPALDEATVAAFDEAGLTVERNSVLTATRVNQPLAPAVDAQVRALESDEDWDARARLSHSLSPRVRPQDFLPYATKRNEAERALEAAGLGKRFGAFVDGELVSTAAAFRAAPGIARYQSVETHPDHRRQGLGAAVVHAAGEHALTDPEVETLVIAADEEGDAIGVYRRLGFTDVEPMWCFDSRS